MAVAGPDGPPGQGGQDRQVGPHVSGLQLERPHWQLRHTRSLPCKGARSGLGSSKPGVGQARWQKSHLGVCFFRLEASEKADSDWRCTQPEPEPELGHYHDDGSLPSS